MISGEGLRHFIRLRGGACGSWAETAEGLAMWASNFIYVVSSLQLRL